MTLECSGNGSSPGFMNAVYNSRWTGTPLAPILKECGIKPGATEVVFFGHDHQAETLRKGTPRELTVEVPFGRSMTIDDANRLNPLLAYERNGEPFAERNGAPLRLIVPGWYGIANVKWLRRIEVRDRRYMGRFMGRDYVTVRGEKQGDEVVFVESSVTRMNLKSVIARVTRRASEGRQGSAQGVRRRVGRRHADQEGRSAAGRRRLAAGDARREAARESTAGDSFRSTWATSRRESTRSFRGRSTNVAGSNPRRRTTKLRSRKRTGRRTSSGCGRLR